MSSQMDFLGPEAMLTFYQRLYPFKSVYNWLNHDQMPTRLFTHREFAFSLQGDVYLRYRSFNSAEDLKKDVCHLNPTRFEIGPVYSGRPRDKKTHRPGTFNPLMRELVFDIDMTDYDPVRTCCSAANICKRCWAFIAAAVKVLDASIREQYGYEKLLWVYSGRRGIHLWISDAEALELTDQQRKAIVGWMSVVTVGSKEQSKRLNHIRTSTKELPPPLKNAVDILKTIFPELILDDQDCFATEEGYETLLEFIPIPAVVKALRDEWSTGSRSSYDKYEDIKRQALKYEKGSVERSQLMTAMEDIVLHYTYPRIDAEVSKHRNHLLKAPFCVHPKTGRVCVPVDPSEIDDFDPEQVPTVGQLLTELDEMIPIDGVETSETDILSRTSLWKYTQMLDKHAADIMESKRIAKQDPDNTMSW